MCSVAATDANPDPLRSDRTRCGRGRLRRCRRAKKMRMRFIPNGPSCAPIGCCGVSFLASERERERERAKSSEIGIGSLMEFVLGRGLGFGRYRFKDGEWKERGLGDSKLLRHRVRGTKGGR